MADKTYVVLVVDTVKKYYHEPGHAMFSVTDSHNGGKIAAVFEEIPFKISRNKITLTPLPKYDIIVNSITAYKDDIDLDIKNSDSMTKRFKDVNDAEMYALSINQMLYPPKKSIFKRIIDYFKSLF